MYPKTQRNSRQRKESPLHLHLYLAENLQQSNGTNKNTNLPARAHGDTRRSNWALPRHLVLALRRLNLQVADHVAGLAELELIGVDVVGDAGGPGRVVLGGGLAPVVAAGVVGLQLALAALVLQLRHQVRLADGGGAHEVLVVGEAGDPGRGADGAGRAPLDCGSEGLVCGPKIRVHSGR